MKDYKCAHCAHCNEIKYDGFFCDKTGYLEHKRIEDDCPDFEADTIDQLAKLVTEKLIAAYPKGAEFTAVRHGRWVNDLFCSECHRFPVDVSVSISNRELTKYFSRCPHCGAIMEVTDTDVGGKEGEAP